MTGSSCFWSLLSKDNFTFLYMPMTVGILKPSNNHEKSISDLLLNCSLFDIMHPNEIELARKDLTRFLKLKVLAGSVTRCRLLSSENMFVYLSSRITRPSANFNMALPNDSKADDMTWNVVDLVLYTVTENTVLAFFHNFDVIPSCINMNPKLKPNCNDGRESFAREDGVNLLKILEQTSKAKTEPNSKVYLDKYNIIPLQLFQVIDKHTEERLFIWPQIYSLNKSLLFDTILTKTQHVELTEFKSSSFSDQSAIEHIFCSRHFYANSKIDILDNYPCNFQRIRIPYGNIVFESLQLTESSSYLSMPSSLLFKGCPSVHLPNMLWNDTTINQSSLRLSDETIVNNILMPSKIEVETISHPNEKDQNSQVIVNNSFDDPNFSGYPMFQKFRVKRLENQPGDFFNSSSSTEKKRKASFHKSLDSRVARKSGKMCARCQTTNSPEWRRGPDGHKTLCNACGLRYSRYMSKQYNANKQ